jgi:cysteine desulfurase
MYLDYAATTPVDPQVAAQMAECLTFSGNFANPSSATHEYGHQASARVELARAQVAGAIGAEPDDLVWTSGATEANNLAIFGLADYYRGQGRHIVTSRTEHKAVLDPCRELEKRGWRVTYLVPDQGVIQPDQVAAALTEDTVLVSIMHVNNEIGVVQDIAGVASVCARRGVKLHVDAAQSMGKTALDFGAMGIDAMSLSAHKVYGPKGVGALCVSRRRGVQLKAQQHGGGQERGLRAGTIPTHQVAGMGAAFELAQRVSAQEIARIAGLNDRLWRGLSALGGVLRNGRACRSAVVGATATAAADAVPHILNLSFEGVEGESLLAAVTGHIAVSTGSACTSADREPSYVLRALGHSERLAESSLRFSFGRYSTECDIDRAIAALSGAVARLRRIGGCISGPAGS